MSDLKTLQDHAREYLASVRPAEGTPALSKEPTPYAVHCREHGKQYLTEDEYGRQLCCPDNLWSCPICGKAAQWDDDNYENTLGI